MKKKVLIAVAVLAGLLAAMAIVGWTLPQGHHVSRTATIAAAPAQVFAIISDVSKYAEWRGDVTQVEVLPDDGRGTRFREHGPSGPVVFRVELIEAPQRMSVRIDDPGQPFGGTWTYELKPEGEGTSLTITEDGEVYNPLFRFMFNFVFSKTKTLETYLAALQKRVSGGPAS